MFRAVVLALAALTIVAVSPRAQAPTSQELPTFRTGVDVVRLDVTVLDKDHHPVRGLAAKDFTVMEDGRLQNVVAFSEINVDPPVISPAPWLREVAPDVISNTIDTRRLVTIVMDDAGMPFDPGVTKLARLTAYRVLDELGPSDLASVIFTYHGRNQNFTTDRARLKAAIDSVIGHPGALACKSKPIYPACDVDTLARIAAVLTDAPPGRKTVIFIGGGRSLTAGSEDTDVSTLLPAVQQMLRDLHRANVTVYAFDPNGLLVGLATAEDRAPKRVTLGTHDSLRVFAEGTGGRAFVDTNTPEAHVPEVFRESSSYYLLAFQSTNTATDGRFRKIRVLVDRPQVDVRTRSGYLSPKAGKPSGKATPQTPLDRAISNGLPSGELPLSVSVASFASPDGKGAQVIVTTRARHDAEASRRVEFVASAFDDQWNGKGGYRQTIEVGEAPEYEVTARLPLQPGRYEVRVGAESDGHAGSVFADVDVPNFAADRLSLSGLLLERVPALPVADKHAVADLVPVVPTTARTFSAHDQVTVFLRVYQGGKGRVVPVRIVAKVTNEKNSVSSNHETVLEVENFSATRAADYQAVLPLAHLSPGEYVLEVEAQSGAPRLKRSARFAIVSDR